MPRQRRWLNGRHTVHNTVIATYRALRLPQLGVSRLLLYPRLEQLHGRQEEFT